MSIRLKVYNPDEDEKVVRIALYDTSDGGVMLQAVDGAGDDVPQGQLMLINAKSGKIFRYPNVNPGFGFELNLDGRIMIEDMGESPSRSCEGCKHKPVSNIRPANCHTCCHLPSLSSNWEAKE